MLRNDDTIHEISERAAVRGVSSGRMIPRDYVIEGDARWLELYDIARQESRYVFDGLVYQRGRG